MKTSKVETTTKEGGKRGEGKRSEGRLACGAVTVEACTTSATVAHSRGATRCVSSCLAGWPLHPCYGHPAPFSLHKAYITYLLGPMVTVGWAEDLLHPVRLAIAMNHEDCHSLLIASTSKIMHLLPLPPFRLHI